MTTIAECEAQIHRIWRGSFQYELDEALEVRLRESALVGIKATLEAALVEELEAELGTPRYSHSPDGPKPPQRQRSGFFQRRVDTAYGSIADVHVPKLRAGNRA